MLYIRPDAVFDKSKPISGGIPHCFPQVCAAGLLQGRSKLRVLFCHACVYLLRLL